MFTAAARRPSRLALAALLGAGGLLAACGSDDDASTGTTVTTTESGYEEIPMDDVLAGLPTILAAGEAADQAAQAGDFDAVLDEYEELHEAEEQPAQGATSAPGSGHVGQLFPSMKLLMASAWSDTPVATRSASSFSPPSLMRLCAVSMAS